MIIDSKTIFRRTFFIELACFFQVTKIVDYVFYFVASRKPSNSKQRSNQTLISSAEFFLSFLTIEMFNRST